MNVPVGTTGKKRRQAYVILKNGQRKFIKNPNKKKGTSATKKAVTKKAGTKKNTTNQGGRRTTRKYWNLAVILFGIAAGNEITGGQVVKGGNAITAPIKTITDQLRIQYRKYCKTPQMTALALAGTPAALSKGKKYGVPQGYHIGPFRSH